MKILFLGTYIPEERLDYIKSISSFIDYPGLILQNNLHAGLSSLVEVKSIVIPVLRTGFRNRSVGGYKFKWNGCEDNYSISYTNIRGIKEITVPTKAFSIFRKMNYVPDVVFVYSLGTIPYTIATRIKELHPKTIIVSIITDLPQYMSDNNNLVYRLLKKLDSHIVNRLMNQFDGFILLSPYMREKLPIKNKPWCIVEGIYNKVNEPETIPTIDKRVLLYTGALEKRYGLLDLVYAFEKISYDDVELWLCGDGSAVDEIKQLASNDSRIKYWGLVSHKDVLIIQRQATILVNPRHSNEPFTKYSFPSKTMEYLASGTPTLMCRLKSIPTEYDDYLYYFEEETVNGYRTKIEELLSIPRNKLIEKGVRARGFILSNKTIDVQSKRIVNFLESLYH